MKSFDIFLLKRGVFDREVFHVERLDVDMWTRIRLDTDTAGHGHGYRALDTGVRGNGRVRS